jgi:hypothetical protein
VIGGRSSTVLAACLAAFVFGACRSTDGDSGQAPKPDLSKTAFDQLIAAGALRPVEAAPEGAAVEGSVPDTDEETLARSAAKLKEMPPETPPVQAEAPAIAPVPQNPYLVFGKRILVHPESGLIMKPYPLRVGSGRQLLQLLQSYGNFALWQPGGAAQTVDQVRLELYEKLDQELFSNLRISPPPADTPFAIADWLVVVASATRLEDVESFINIFAAGVPQIEIEAEDRRGHADEPARPRRESDRLQHADLRLPTAPSSRAFTYNTPNSAGARERAADDRRRAGRAAVQRRPPGARDVRERLDHLEADDRRARGWPRRDREHGQDPRVRGQRASDATGQFAANAQLRRGRRQAVRDPARRRHADVALNIDIEASAQSGRRSRSPCLRLSDRPVRPLEPDVSQARGRRRSSTSSPGRP